MNLIGVIALDLALVFAGIAIFSALWGRRTGHKPALLLAERSVYVVAGLVTLAVITLWGLIFANDFLVRSVQGSSSRGLEWYYKLTLLWVDLESSMLFWAWILSVFSALAVRLHRRSLADLIPMASAVLMAVLAFFLYLILFQKNPFDTYLREEYLTGNGMRPLLRNPWMLIHPPLQYLGYIATTVPFAFCVAALLRPGGSERRDDDWLTVMRPWFIGGWLGLGFGLVLGMGWAYELIDWGGWWSWDPIENASLFPWFVSTALLHSALIYRRRRLLRGWALSLSILTFWLTIIGTFMTRSGIVRSVHSFGEDKALAWSFAVFMGLGMAGSFGLLLARMGDMKAKAARIKSFFSLEYVFVLANWNLLLAAVFVLTATLYPTLSEWLFNERVTVGPPFYHRYMVPLGLSLLVLTALPPLLSWHKNTLKRFLDQLFWPVLTMVTVALALPMLWPKTFPYTHDVDLWWAGTRVIPGLSLTQFAIGLSAFLFAGIAQHYLRLVRIRARVQREPIRLALGRVFVANRIRYCAYLVHLGVALMFLGFAGKARVQQEDRVLQPGQSFTVAGIELQYQSVVFHQGAEADSEQAIIFMRTPGDPEGRALTPSNKIFHDNPSMPMSKVALVRGFGQDLHVRLAGRSGRSVTLKVAVHPLVSWLWLGFLLMAVAALIGIFPRFSKPPPPESKKQPSEGAPRKALWIAVAALATVWLVGLGYWTSVSIPGHATGAALAVWIIGALGLVVAFAMLWSFMPLMLPADGDDALASTAPAADELRRAQLVADLRLIEEEEQLGKISPEEALPLRKETRRELAVLLADEQAEARREDFARAFKTKKPVSFSAPAEEVKG